LARPRFSQAYRYRGLTLTDLEGLNPLFATVNPPSQVDIRIPDWILSAAKALHPKPVHPLERLLSSLKARPRADCSGDSEFQWPDLKTRERMVIEW
jgi:hypothetical protein